MRVVLLENVPGTGQRGDVKEVATGYARNFLFPKKLARIATKTSLHDLREKLERDTKKNENELKDSQKLASKLDGVEIEISEKASNGGKLFAAVSKDSVADAIKKELKININSKQVVMDSPIKEPGKYNIKIEFGHGLEAEMSLIVNEI
jgi:large subunit ribosomal protein L9